MTDNRWSRDGDTWPQNGEVAPDCEPYDGAVFTGDEWSAFYINDNRRASFTYYVLEVNRDDEETTWDVGEIFHYWEVDADGEPDEGPTEIYEYEFREYFAFHSYDEAKARAKECADTDESFFLIGVTYEG